MRTKRVDRNVDYRSGLLAERARLVYGRQTELEILVGPGPLAVEDQAPLAHDQFVILRQRRMDNRKLKLIDAALERIALGEFGLCAECEELIPAKRLEIVPWAACCVSCQDRADARDIPETDDELEMIA